MVTADEKTRSLGHMKRIYEAQCGVKGSKNHCHGKNASHTIVKVCHQLNLFRKTSYVMYILIENGVKPISYVL